MDFQHRWPCEIGDASSTSPQATGWIWTYAWALGRSPGGTRCSHPVRRNWTFVVSMLSLLRIGEASHPGPQPAGWTLGIANPSGLNSKVEQIAHMEGHAWILSETHLSAVGLRNFVKGLKAVKSPWVAVVPGAPCPARNQHGTGNHSGVMLLSQSPARPLPNNFAAHTFCTARMQVAGMVVGNMWVTLGMLYGVPANAQHHDAKYQTEVMLSELVERVALQGTGPRAIGGDFSFAASELGQTQRLHELGFREAQNLAALRWGQSSVQTGRGRRIIDQLWLSPELQQVLIGVEVQHDMWADHSPVVAKFAGGGVPSIPHWRMPQPFPWPADWTCQVEFQPGTDLTLEYARLWAQVESGAVQWNAHHGIPSTRAQQGRGQTLTTVHRVAHQVPCRKERVGEVAPTFYGVSLQHARYFKQLRRLQSLRHQQARGVSGFHACMNREDTWRAVRRAPGFPGGFGGWWSANGFLPVFPSGMPLICPSGGELDTMFESMNKWVKAYEAGLAQKRYQFGKQRRAGSLQYVFKDCKTAAPPPVDTLLQRLEVGIDEVRPEEASIVLTSPVTLLPDLPVVVNGKVLQVIHQEHDQLWVENLDGVAAGHMVVQERVTMSETEIINKFHEVWMPRWNKTHHVVPSQWTQICQFAENALPRLEWTYEPWTCGRFQQAVKRKKKTSGKGPDGVGQPDLEALPQPAVQAFVSVLQAIETGSPWPAQVASGFVNSLAKHLQAQHIDDYRPVTVYSLFYRVWSSERAREALKVLTPALPAGIQGGVPGRQAKTIWYQLAQTLEFAFMDDVPVHGLLMDIRKAFNAIPRLPLWCALKTLGFPVHILRAWCSFVACQTRRFKVRQAVGDPVSSNCGLPEGCGLSVVGMIVVDWLLDCWLAAHTTGVSLRAFVDDWGLMFGSVEAFPVLWTTVQEFVTAMDLSLDMQKTRLWSSHGAARAQLKDFEVALAHHARNLGAHQNFTKHCWNGVLQTRLAGMATIWPLLKASLSPYAHKIQALKILAWPRALHGISVVHLGFAHYKVLRSGAMRGLKADRKGANPQLHLASNAVLADPEAWAIFQTIRDARELGGFERMESILGLFASTPDALPRNGPTAVLNARLQRLGWTVGQHGLLQDRFGSFSLFDIAWDDLCLRFHMAWAHVLATDVGHRPTFDGLAEVDVVATQQALQYFGPADQVYLRCHMDGTLFVQNGKAKFQQGVDDKCLWCGKKDGFAHRAWVCPHFESCRSHLTSEQRRHAASLPQAFSVHGWALELAEWDAYVDFLLHDDGSRRMSPVGLPSFRTHHWVDLFVDGTCAHPTEPKLRYGAWAVTAATGGPGILDNHLVLGGHLEGLCQSAYRAELSAVYHALVWASERCYKVRLWCDCQGVVQGLRKLLKGGRLRPNRSHSDLWQRIAAIIQQSSMEIQIIKVVSHCQVSAARSPEEEWAYWHNKLTDEAAASINGRRSEAFWHAWRVLAAALTERRALHMAILQMLLKQSRLASQEKAGSRNSVPVVVPITAAMPAAPLRWQSSDALYKKYGQANVDAIHQWWSACGTEALGGRADLKLISGIQLFLDFAWVTGHNGPYVHRKRWYDSQEEVPTGGVVRWSDRVKPFLLLWKAYLRCNGVCIPNKMARPVGLSVCRWLVSYFLRWPIEKVQAVDTHIFGQLGRQLVSQRDMQCVTSGQ